MHTAPCHGAWLRVTTWAGLKGRILAGPPASQSGKLVHDTDRVSSHVRRLEGENESSSAVQPADRWSREGGGHGPSGSGGS